MQWQLFQNAPLPFSCQCGSSAVSCSRVQCCQGMRPWPPYQRVTEDVVTLLITACSVGWAERSKCRALHYTGSALANRMQRFDLLYAAVLVLLRSPSEGPTKKTTLILKELVFRPWVPRWQAFLSDFRGCRSAFDPGRVCVCAVCSVQCASSSCCYTCMWFRRCVIPK